jgi:hypothetical protein
MAERRTGYRQRVLKTGKIIFNGSASVIDCAVRNVSESGACLMVVNAVVVPAEFTLQWDGGSRFCSVVWRQINRLGVEFPQSAVGSRVGEYHSCPICPRCDVEMTMIHRLPADGELPEVQAFKCERCAQTIVRENEEVQVGGR